MRFPKFRAEQPPLTAHSISNAAPPIGHEGTVRMYLHLSDLTQGHTVTRLHCESGRECGYSELLDVENAIRDHGDLPIIECDFYTLSVRNAEQGRA